MKGCGKSFFQQAKNVDKTRVFRFSLNIYIKFRIIKYKNNENKVIQNILCTIGSSKILTYWMN